MRMRILVGFAVVAALLAPMSLRAADPKAPTIVLRMKSIEGILHDAHYIAKLAGQEDKVEQVDGILKTMDIGIDQKKPIGLYIDMSEGGGAGLPSFVALVPVANEEALLNLLKNQLNLMPQKGDDGVYTIENVPSVPTAIYIRFDHGYACVTAMDKSNISKEKLLSPSKVLPDDDAIIALDARISSIPDQGKQMILMGLEEALKKVKEQTPPNETPEQAKLREQMMARAGEQLKKIINEGDEFSLRLGVDAKKDDISLEVSFKAKPGTSLAKEMNEGRGKSLFTSLAGSDDAIRALGNVRLPEETRQAIGPMFDEFAKKALEKETDESKKALLKAGIETITPTIKAGVVDLGAVLRGPDSNGHFTAVGGLEVKDGKAIDELIHKVCKDLPEKDKGKVTLDAASADGMKIHKILAEEMDANGQKLFGSKDVYVGIADNMVVIGLGPDGLNAVKAAASAKPASAPAIDVMVSIARCAELDKKDDKAAKAAKAIFGEHPEGKDTITIKAETGEKSRLEVHFKGKIIEFGVKANGDADK